MKKSILELKGVQVLTKNEQISIKGSGCAISWCCGGFNEPPCQLD